MKGKERCEATGWCTHRLTAPTTRPPPTPRYGGSSLLGNKWRYTLEGITISVATNSLHYPCFFCQHCIIFTTLKITIIQNKAWPLSLSNIHTNSWTNSLEANGALSATNYGWLSNALFFLKIMLTTLCLNEVMCEGKTKSERKEGLPTLCMRLAVAVIATHSLTHSSHPQLCFSLFISLGILYSHIIQFSRCMDDVFLLYNQAKEGRSTFFQCPSKWK